MKKSNVYNLILIMIIAILLIRCCKNEYDYSFTISSYGYHGVVNITTCNAGATTNIYQKIEAKDMYSGAITRKKLEGTGIYCLYEKNDSTIAVVYGGKFQKDTLAFIFRKRKQND